MAKKGWGVLLLAGLAGAGAFAAYNAVKSSGKPLSELVIEHLERFKGPKNFEGVSYGTMQKEAHTAADATANAFDGYDDINE